MLVLTPNKTWATSPWRNSAEFVILNANNQHYKNLGGGFIAFGGGGGGDCIFEGALQFLGGGGSLHFWHLGGGGTTWKYVILL